MTATQSRIHLHLGSGQRAITTSCVARQSDVGTETDQSLPSIIAIIFSTPSPSSTLNATHKSISISSPARLRCIAWGELERTVDAGTWRAT